MKFNTCYQNAINKIEKSRPRFPVYYCCYGKQGKDGPPGPKGEKGDQGPRGLENIKAAYLTTFNNIENNEYVVNEDDRIPISKKENDIYNICTLDSKNNTIKFNIQGNYKISFKIHATLHCYNTYTMDNRFISIGLREINTDNTYIGDSEWLYYGKPEKIYGEGIIYIDDTKNIYEIANLSKKPIYLNTPNIKKIKTNKYYCNALVTITIEYLGI